MVIAGPLAARQVHQQGPVPNPYPPANLKLIKTLTLTLTPMLTSTPKMTLTYPDPDLNDSKSLSVSALTALSAQDVFDVQVVCAVLRS